MLCCYYFYAYSSRVKIHLQLPSSHQGLPSRPIQVLNCRVWKSGCVPGTHASQGPLTSSTREAQGEPGLVEPSPLWSGAIAVLAGDLVHH